MKKKAIICDLDGTLIQNPDWNGDYETFYQNITKGFPVEWCELLLNSLADKVKIIFLTARDDKCKSITEHQLNSWFDFSYILLMRITGDTREDYIIKQEHLSSLMEEYDILFCIDDNPKNCEMFSQYIPTLKVF